MYGGIAQLGERLNGIQEVSGSIPLISTITRVTQKTRFFGNGVFVLCHTDCKVRGKLLQVDVEVDAQLIVPADLHPFDEAVDNHLFGLQAGPSYISAPPYRRSGRRQAVPEGR